MSSKNSSLRRMILASMFLALALVLPFLTGQIPQIGAMLCPMHIPVLLCGFFSGPWYALAVGVMAPILRFVCFGMPPLMPTGLAMCFELAAYGVVAGLLYRHWPKKPVFTYLALILAMLAGRALWGAVMVVILGIRGSGFGWTAFMTGAFANAVPGIAVQIVLIPILVMALKRYTVNE